MNRASEVLSNPQGILVRSNYDVGSYNREILAVAQRVLHVAA